MTNISDGGSRVFLGEQGLAGGQLDPDDFFGADGGVIMLSRNAGAFTIFDDILLEETPLPVGDFNTDGAVDGADYTVWKDTLGSTIDLRADADESGIIDQPDFILWRDNFGEVVSFGSAAGFGAAQQAVPEPSSALLALLVAALQFSVLRRDNQISQRTSL